MCIVNLSIDQVGMGFGRPCNSLTFKVQAQARPKQKPKDGRHFSVPTRVILAWNHEKERPKSGPNSFQATKQGTSLS